MKQFILALALGVLVAASAVFAIELQRIGSTTRIAAVPSEDGRPNIVFILTDDQRFDDDFIPFVEQVFKTTGVVFSNAFVSDPLCCPVRSSIVSGGFYSHQTQVLNNSMPLGSVANFHDTDTLLTRLQASGVRTALVGKYLNGYVFSVSAQSLKIPPGLDYAWLTDNSSDWLNWKVVHGGSTPTARGEGTLQSVTQYSTNFLGQKAVDFINNYTPDPKHPFFLFFTPLAPHSPSSPVIDGNHDDQQYLGLTYRGRGWGEQPDGDVSDKPLFVQGGWPHWWGGSDDFYTEENPFRRGHRTPDDLYVHRAQSLLSVGRQIEAIYNAVAAKGLLEKTVFIFAGDNGFMMGEHGLFNKGLAYEESIRVPLIVVAPGVVPQTASDLVALDLDIPNYILELERVDKFNGSPGRVPPVLLGQSGGGHSRLFFEAWPERVDSDDPGDDIGHTVPRWSALRDNRYKYVQYSTGEQELYDLVADPYELQNLADDPAYQELEKSYQSEVRNVKGLAIQTPLADFAGGNTAMPPATIGTAYTYQFKSWGGEGPYRWSLHGGSLLPAGLTLDVNGLLSGTPTGPVGVKTFSVKVEDSSDSPVPGVTNQRDILKFGLQVQA